MSQFGYALIELREDLRRGLEQLVARGDLRPVHIIVLWGTLEERTQRDIADFLGLAQSTVSGLLEECMDIIRESGLLEGWEGGVG